jgi:AraC family transcriptional regulator
VKSATEKDHAERIVDVLLAIEQSLDDDLRPDRLARHAALSPFYFQRVFRALVGESVAEHVRRLRLERAAHRLKTTSMSVLEIALEAKYDSNEAFTRAFRSAFGVAPSAFRSASEGRLLARPAIAPERRENTKLLEGRIVDHDPIRVVFVRHVGPYENAASAFDRLDAWAASVGISRNAQRIGAPRDDPSVTPREKLRFDACVVVDASVTADGEVGIQLLGGGPYAVTCHVGPFDTLAETYAWLAVEWLPGRGRTIAKAPCLELYRDWPGATAPGDRVTELRVPVV